MTTIWLADCMQSPEIIVGEREKHALTVVALTEVASAAEQIDYLLYELGRARVMPDAQLPSDVVRIGSIVRYVAGAEGQERTVKLVMPGDVDAGTYRIAATSEHGAALLGLRPGQTTSWLDRTGTMQQLQVLAVTTLPEASTAVSRT
jgi:regulator of nucleoside diphosphate kinase